jgi:small-conductance mechanosensitive channel
MPLPLQGARRPARARTWRWLGLTVAALLVATFAGAQPQPLPPTILDPAIAQAVAAATVDAPPATLSFVNREIVTFRGTLLLRTPDVRAAGALRILDELANQPAVAVSSRPLAGGYVISVGQRDLLALIPADIDPAGTQTLEQLAGTTVARLEQALGEAVEMRTPGRLLWGGGLALLATLVLVVLLRVLFRTHAATTRAVTAIADRQLQRVPGGELMRATRMPEVVRYAMGVVMTGLGVFVVYAWLTFTLRRFPYTRPWGEALRGFLLERLTVFARDIINALPDLFTVLLIVLLTRMVGRALGLVFNAVEEGRATLPGVHPETAASTRRLVNGLLWLFALALAYPYLPGSDTDAFKGVSVFVGLIVSLGSSGIVTQMMSGLTLTYSRALRVNDFVRIGDIEGTVTYLGSLSAKIRTLRNEEVTIPNAVVVGNQIVNYSRLAGSEGVYVGTTVTIGYDVPWRQVRALLLEAAGRTDGVRSTPPPRVRQSGLRDFYVEYLLLIALEDPTLRVATLDRLHGHILDAFNEHGVQIMSPSYEADPEGKKIVPRDQWFASPASPPAQPPPR